MTRVPLSLELIEHFSRLLEIRSEWSAFARTIDGLTPFQLPEWLVTWWRHFGSGALRCFVFREGGEIAGIVPCFLHHWNGKRQITLLGAGISDYLEPALKPEREHEMVSQIQSHLNSTSDWDICHWQDLSGNTPFQQLACEFAEDTPCMAIPLNGTFEAYWETCARTLRQNVRRDRAKAESQGEIRFHVATAPEPELLDSLIEMHRARWQRQDQPGMIEANGSEAFLRDVAYGFASLGMLRIFSLQFGRKLVAVIFAFDYHGRISNYLTAFDPEYERLGFGRTLLYEAVRYSFQKGYKAWDFLRGEEQYKHWWRAQVIPKSRVVVTRTAAGNRLPSALHRNAAEPSHDT